MSWISRSWPVFLSIKLSALWVHCYKRRFSRKCCVTDISFRAINVPITVHLNPDLKGITYFLHLAQSCSSCAKLGFSMVWDMLYRYRLSAVLLASLSCKVRPSWEEADETNSFQLFSAAGRSLTETAVNVSLHSTNPICALALGHVFFFFFFAPLKCLLLTQLFSWCKLWLLLSYISFIKSMKS